MVPHDAALQVFMKTNIYLRKDTRTCSVHLDTNGLGFTDEAFAAIPTIASLKPYQLKDFELNSLLDDLRLLAMKPRIDFSSNGLRTDSDYLELTGLSIADYNKLYAFLKPCVKW